MTFQVTYSGWLIAGSLAIAIMAAFSALRITSNLRSLSAAQKKLRISQAAIIYGLGIWSMHFVGMLAISLPIPITYDPLPTLVSALIAILAVGGSFLLLHFWPRTLRQIVLAGVLTGLGIVGMHFLGMSAISSNCLVLVDKTGVVITLFIAVILAALGFAISYRSRTLTGVVLGSVTLGVTVSAMHWTAIFFTAFGLAEGVTISAEPFLARNDLALVVTGSSFFLSGLFMLLAVPSTTGRTDQMMQPAAATYPPVPVGPPATATPGAALDSMSALQIPYEINGMTKFVAHGTILVVKADGHYSSLICRDKNVFCPWPISRVEKVLNPSAFVRTHRSYIINRSKISGFRQVGGKAVCLIGDGETVEVPVSRNRIAGIRSMLNLN